MQPVLPALFLDPPGSLPLETADAALSQGEDLGFQVVCLTGGEVALYPHLGELLRLIADKCPLRIKWANLVRQLITLSLE